MRATRAVARKRCMPADALIWDGTLVAADPNKDVCATPYWDDAAPYATETYIPTFYNRTADFTVRRFQTAFTLVPPRITLSSPGVWQRITGTCFTVQDRIMPLGRRPHEVYFSGAVSTYTGRYSGGVRQVRIIARAHGKTSCPVPSCALRRTSFQAQYEHPLPSE